MTKRIQLAKYIVHQQQPYKDIVVPMLTRYKILAEVGHEKDPESALTYEF